MRSPVAPGVEALVDENPVYPAKEALRWIVGVKLPVRLDECVLGRVARLVVIPEHPHRDSEQYPLVPLHNGAEGCRIALERPSDKGCVVRIL